MATTSIRARIYATSSYDKAKDVDVIFEISNTGNVDVYVLKWNTPLEGLRSDCLEVIHNRKFVPYDGILVKRGLPTQENYVEVKVGQTVSVKVDVAEGYDLSKKGTVSIAFNSENLVVIPATEAVSDAEFTTAVQAKKRRKIDNKPARFKVDGNTKRKTVGQSYRIGKKKVKIALASDADATALDPQIVDAANDAEKNSAIKAHHDGYTLVVESLGALANDARYKEWFGAHTPSRLSTVKTNYDKVKKRMETVRFTYYCHGSACRPGDFAYTTHGNDKIWLCSAFRNAQPTGPDSKAGTIVHEHTHATSSTEDIVYGRNNCRSLARSTPDDAINNADNYEYYSKG
ncbi:MAG TPA: M35 family metallopeptidase [Cyclobacteriaceae bacterium]|nr:M35 family metallopeptidase [Cyclobacteriaceae bacterium]